MIEWIMMGSFVGALGLSVWKLYLFFPNKRLSDDDTTRESTELLIRIMIESNHPDLSEEKLFELMQKHPEFDRKHFWRFNQNRLRQLIIHYRFIDPKFRL